MENRPYHVRVTRHHTGTGGPTLDAWFGRINVVLGANGTGKSRLLMAVRQFEGVFGKSREVLYIQGGRVIRPPDTIQLDRSNISIFSSPQNTADHMRGRRAQPVDDRIKDVFLLLDRRGSELKGKHSDAVEEWRTSGCSGECPRPEEHPLQLLFRMFSAVFPEIQLRLDSTTNRLLCLKNDSEYPPSHLSDGERQVLFILADVAISAESDSLVVADEPELNLNPQLAVRLWETIEQRLPDAVFVYSTHSIGFSMRPGVDTVTVLQGGGEPAIVIGDLRDLPAGEVRELLGAIPAIVAAPAALVVEGHDSSFDSEFYRWIVGRQNIAIVPLGGCQDVIGAVERTGVWEKLAPSVRLAGVIDRDYRSAEWVADRSGNCVVLEYHEAESYLCHPQVFAAIAAALGTAEIIPTEDEIRHRISENFKQAALRTVAGRVAFQTVTRLAVSVPSRDLKAAADPATARALFQKAAEDEATKANEILSSDRAGALFDAEMAACDHAIRMHDTEAMLRLGPAKELLNTLARRVECGMQRLLPVRLSSN